MANNHDITEVALAVLCDKTAAHNTFAARTNGQLDTLVVRVNGHDDNTDEEGDDINLMALFESKEFGAPWVKQKNVHQRVKYDCSISGDAETVATARSDAQIYVANFDYAGGYPE